jgi:hypothetical protein
MAALQKKTELWTENFDLRQIQKCILNLEDIFYFTTGEKRDLDHKKIDVNSTSYDRIYEQKTRRRELNLLYVLDEIFLINRIYSHSAMDLLTDLEDTIFSSAFHRQLIFGVFDVSVIKKMQKLITTSKKKIDFLQKKISNENYIASISGLEFLFPPTSKDEFLDELQKLIIFIENKILLLK